MLVEGVPDQLLEPFDGAGQCDEFVESGAACPGDPAGEELFSSAAFGGEHGPEVFQISCWSRLMVRASATNSWSRERRAQAIQPARSCSPLRPLVANTARSCSLSRWARYRAVFVVLIVARLCRWSAVRSSGFFTTAQRALRSRSPACSRVRRRTLSSALVAHITTWNGSRQIAACGAFSRTTAWIHSGAARLE